MELAGDHRSAATTKDPHHNSESTSSFTSTGGNLLSDLLRSCSKQEKSELAGEFFKQENSFKANSPSFKEEAKHFSADELAKEFKCEPREPGNFSSTNDNRDDRPDYNPFESNDQSANSRPDSKPNEEDTRSKPSTQTISQLSNQMNNQMSNQMETDEASAMSEKSKNPLSLMSELLRCKGQPASATTYKIEDDFYAELPANTPLQELVRCALTKQGYSVEDCSAAKGG